MTLCLQQASLGIFTLVIKKMNSSWTIYTEGDLSPRNGSNDFHEAQYADFMKIVGTEIQIKYMQDMLVQRFLIDSVQHLKRTRDLSTAVAQATTAPPRQYLLPVCSIMRASTSHHDRRTQSHWRPLALLECLDVSFLGKFGDCNHT